MPPAVDFVTFCVATRAWLAAAPSPDAALVAAADLLELGLDPRGLDALCVGADSDDVHALLGAHALETLRHIAHGLLAEDSL